MWCNTLCTWSAQHAFFLTIFSYMLCFAILSFQFRTPIPNPQGSGPAPSQTCPKRDSAQAKAWAKDVQAMFKPESFTMFHLW